NLVDQTRYDAGDVVDIVEMAAHVALVEQLDRRALEDRLCKKEDWHVGPAPWTIDGEKAQARHRKAVKVTIGIRHQLVRLLRRSVEAHGMIGPVGDRVRQLRVGTVDRRRT